MAAVSLALRLAAGALLVATVAGCGGPPLAPYSKAVSPNGPPWVVARSPELVALRWYDNQTPAAAATALARAHCARYGKAAVLVSDEQSGGARIAQFACR